MQLADRRGFGVRNFADGLTRPRAKVGVRLLPFVVICAAVALRVMPLLAHYPLHRDEALYGAWARLIASGMDPLLLTAWIDKPPLVIYLLAGSLRLFGAGDIALRLPGMIASLTCVALVYGLARRAYDGRVALLASILCACSPFAILFAPTAFTDPWLTVWLLASAWAALASKPFWAGILLGLAVASKQQGVLAAPLVLGLSALRAAEETGSKAKPFDFRAFFVDRVLPTLAGFLVVFIPLTYWDSLRWTKRPSFWGRSLETYGGLRIARPEDWPGRITAWSRQAAWLWGAMPATLLVAAFGLLPGILALRQAWARRRQVRLNLASCVDLMLSAYAAGYLALHVLATFQPWDRYLLPLIPLIAILAARGLVEVWERSGRLPRRATGRHPLMLGLALLLAWASWTGVSGRLPVGSDHGAFDNLDKVVALVRSRPASALVYHHSLGWYFDFYLFDAPQQRPWWENSWQLADLASRTAHLEPGREQWLVLTGWEDPVGEGIPAALANWGLALREEESIYRHDRTRAFTVCQIIARGRAIP